MLGTTGKDRAQSFHWTAVVVFIAIASWVAASVKTINSVLTSGRGAYALTFDDVVYARVGQELAARSASGGPLQPLRDWIAGSPHAPLSDLVAFGVHALPGPHPEMLYVANGLASSLLLLALASCFVSAWAPRFALAALFVTSPFGYLLTNEYRPDLWFTTVSAILLVGSIPYRTSTRRPVGLAPVSISALSLLLLFLKPSWLAFSVAVTAAALVMNYFAARQQPSTQSLLVRWWPAVLLFIFGIIVWFIWLRDHFFGYVSNALSQSYRLASSPLSAVLESLSGAEVYLGITHEMFLVGFGVALLALSAALSTTFDRRRLLVSMSASLLILVVSAVSLFATAYSRHPSPFQGLYFYGLLMAWILAVTLFSLKDVLRRFVPQLQSSFTLTLTIIIAVPGVLAVSSLKSDLTYPELHKANVAPVIRLAAAILEACKSDRQCDQRSSPSVYVTFAEDVNSVGIAYYLRANGAQASVTGANMDSGSVVDVVMEAGKFDLVVVRKKDFPANKLPVNQIQSEIVDALKSDREFVEFPLAGSLSDYSVFRNQR